MRRIFSLLIVLLLAATASGLTRKQLQINDEWGEPVTDITTITVYDAGTSTASTLYKDRDGNTSVTNPITTTSTNTTFTQHNGAVYFWSKDADYKVTVTDGTASITIDNMTGARTTFPFWDIYYSAMSSYNLGDSDDLVFGTDSDWELDCDTAQTLDAIPAVNDSAMNIGSTNYVSDLNLYGDTSGRNLYWDASENTLEVLDSTILAIGSGDDLTIAHDGTTTTVTGGWTQSGEIIISASDVLFNDTYDISWDTSRDQLLFEDNAVLGIGGAHDAAADVTFKWDASNLLIESAAEDTGEIRYGSTNAIDVAHYGNTNTNIAKFNANTSTLELNGYDLQIQDADLLMFGDDDDFTIFSDTANILEFDPATAGNEIRFGTSATDAVDLTWYSDTTGSTVSFDEENVTVNFGADNTGVDVVFFGATASQKCWWDESGDEWFYGADAEGVDVTFYADTTGNYAKWDEDGSTNGAMVFEDSIVHMMDDTDIVFGDGSDITVEYDEDGTDTLLITGNTFVSGTFGCSMVTEAVTGTSDTLTAAQSGSMIVYTMTGGACTATLPSAAAGLWFVLMDGNATAGNDLTVDPATGDSINGDTAGQYIKCENDQDGEAVLIFATDATNWYACLIGNSTVWTEE